MSAQRFRAVGDKVVLVSKPVGLDSVARFAHSLAVMLTAGIGLVKALEILAHSDGDGRVALAADQLSQSVGSGSSFSSALLRLGGAFSVIFVRMIRAGESCGDLPKVLLGLAKDAERQRRNVGALTRALMYPTVVLGVSLSITAFMATYMLPRLLGFILDLGDELPFITKVLVFLVFSPALRYGALAMLATGILSANYLRHHPAMRRKLYEKVKYNLPVVGRAFTLMDASLFCSQLSMMGDSGVTLLEALRILEEGSGNEQMDLAVSRVRERITDGESFARALEPEPIFPRIVSQMVGVAEESSSMYGELGRLAVLLADESENRMEAVLPALEPLLIGVMGLLVGFVVIATFLPIYHLVAMKI